MYYEDIVETAVNDETTDDFRLRTQTTADAVKKLDRNYEKYKLVFNDIGPDGKYHKYITIENFGSGSYGSKIRNAVTGSYYNYIVGSSDEDLFFKVVEATGRNGRKEPLTLFYDSPEQYENQHFRTVSVSQEAKDLWVTRSHRAQRVHS